MDAVAADRRTPMAVPDASGKAVLAALAASLLLHAAIVTIWGLSPADPTGTPAERSVSVEILTSDQWESMRHSPAGRLPSLQEVPSSPDRPAPSSPPAEQDDGLIRPRTMLAAQALARPRSREARAILGTLDGTERMIQLCGIEAMEQIEAWNADLAPDRVVAYARREVAVAADTVTADGAAIRIGRDWRALRFNCTVSADRETVTRFAFQLGATIPTERWEPMGLTADFADTSD